MEYLYQSDGHNNLCHKIVVNNNYWAVLEEIRKACPE
jgi:hypothetical protein